MGLRSIFYPASHWLRQPGCGPSEVHDRHFAAAAVALASRWTAARYCSSSRSLRTRSTRRPLPYGRHPEALPDPEHELPWPVTLHFARTTRRRISVNPRIISLVEPTKTQVDISVYRACANIFFLKAPELQLGHVSVSSRALRQLRKVELVTALDNSGSMAGTRITPEVGSKHACRSALRLCRSVSEFVKIGLVPFSGAVNVGVANLGNGVLDLARLSPIHAEDVHLLPATTLLDLFSGSNMSAWAGLRQGACRPGAATTLPTSSPNASAGENSVVPYFAPR